MNFMQKLYLFAGIAAIVLAVTVPYWLPKEWTTKKMKKHSTEGSPFPFDIFASSEKSNDNNNKAPIPGGSSSKPSGSTSDDVSSTNNNKVKKPSGDDGGDDFPFTVGDGSVKVFNKEELSSYKENPLYLVVLGEVYDVTTGDRFYNKDSGYHCFVGQDNSAAFDTGKFTEVQEDVRGLPQKSIAGVVGWRTFYRKHETYKFVGVVQGIYFDENGMPTAGLEQVQKATKSAAAGEAEDERRAKLFPRCNMHFDGRQQTTVVWCDGYREMMDLAKIPQDKDLRVLRMVYFKSVATGQDQRDCRCLRPSNGEADIGSSPFPSARVDYYFKEKGCDPNLPRCLMKNM